MVMAKHNHKNKHTKNGMLLFILRIVLPIGVAWILLIQLSSWTRQSSSSSSSSSNSSNKEKTSQLRNTNNDLKKDQTQTHHEQEVTAKKKPLEEAHSATLVSSTSAHGVISTPPLQPNGIVIKDTELFYMIPSDIGNNNSVKGILIYFHGCNHGGHDMFLLPEDRRVVSEALRRDLAVVSITSRNRRSGCWSARNLDFITKYDDVIGQFIRQVGLATTEEEEVKALPRMGMGASSGGGILFDVWNILQLKSLASYITYYNGKGPEDYSISSSSSSASVPPTVFVHMPRDTRTARIVASHAKALESAGTPTLMLEVQPQPFNVERCSNRIPELGEERCTALIQHVLSKHPDLLDATDFSVRFSSQSGDWGDVIKELKLDDITDDELLLQGQQGVVTRQQNDYVKGTIPPRNFGDKHSWVGAAILEEVAACHGMHEMVSDHIGQVLDFLMVHAGIDMGYPKQN